MGQAAIMTQVRRLRAGYARTAARAAARRSARRASPGVGIAVVLMLSGSAVAEPGLWRIDPDSSYIRFRAVQAGARFTGDIRRFDARIRFDPDDLEASRASVEIDVTSIDTADDERDDVLRSDEWFHIARFPTVTFSAGEFVRNGDHGFAAQGVLGIKGLSADVPFHFDVTRDGDRVVLDGTATLDRLRLRLGLGEWADTTWIGRDVDVVVRVTATIGDD